MLSTNGLSLINTLLEEGQLGELIRQISQLVRIDILPSLKGWGF
ncbi:hypothetical protein [Nodularia spumigena]|uniref:Recombination and DNA strand exchange inhibitor protein n=1 Tax=Nodularia spumigena CENA596 TaxID=1819295 RepID=A0A166I0D4_NODSP|nr:hypothetical protein [Nodularia spumigena]MDB9323574.1 recombination and DNA strand exchange inhibitor protein [Nodularia spumigena CS-591/07A]MDB9332551.1 recombination and DNA strand exchange inhibitor protein [Nodularia spumigena CS-591/04]MDB9360787.1 recombination and DNA strand exchange inhibitor protein [Nodularia spumigena CS-588/02]MDB9367069.1 recombination and DNA strand exchange inhibitor protein [Nodularia spumigena CS-588/02A10]MDB9399798.1 hypothetical protein [Microcystis ae